MSDAINNDSKKTRPRHFVVGAILLGALMVAEITLPSLMATGGTDPGDAPLLFGAVPGQTRSGPDVLCPQLLSAGPDPVNWHYEMTAKQVMWQLTPGKKVPMWTWNGTIPGPAICAREGDEVTMTIHNEISTIVSLHAHGLKYDATSDGSFHAKEYTAPGGSYTYHYKVGADSVGTWIYHDAVAKMNQLDFQRLPESGEGIERGLYGPVIVYGKSEPVVDHEILIAMADIGDEISHAGKIEVFDGHIWPLTPKIYAYEGETVRFRLINPGPNDPHNFVVQGHKLVNAHTGTSVDGNQVHDASKPGVILGALTFGDYTLTAGAPGTYTYLCVVGDHAARGMRGDLIVLPKPSANNATTP